MAIADSSGNVPEKAQKLVESLLRLGIDGVGPLKNARESAEEALAKSASKEDAVKSLIRTHVAWAGAQGFATNLGGIIMLPGALPVNIGAAFLIQTHLAASIAHLRGHDTDDESVRAAILLCLLGNAAVEVLKKVGISVGEKLAFAMIKRLPMEVIWAIHKRVGFMLIAKYGTKRSVITLAKFIPLIGGIVGGGFDAAATHAVGAFAAHFFHATPLPPQPPSDAGKDTGVHPGVNRNGEYAGTSPSRPEWVSSS